MEIIPINSLSTMIQLASTALQFSHFELVSTNLLSKCAEFFQKNISILQQYLLYVSTLSPLPFKVSAVSEFWLRPQAHLKHSAIILERSLML